MSNTKKANFLQKKAFKISLPVSQALFKDFITEQIFLIFHARGGSKNQMYFLCRLEPVMYIWLSFVQVLLQKFILVARKEICGILILSNFASLNQFQANVPFLYS